MRPIFSPVLAIYHAFIVIAADISVGNSLSQSTLTSATTNINTASSTDAYPILPLSVLGIDISALVEVSKSKSEISTLWDGISVKRGDISTVQEPKFISVTSPEELPSIRTPNLKLPPHFIWGVESSAYSIEGAADADGKGPSVWDWATHNARNFTLGGAIGDISANNYYLYKEDIQRIKALGMPYYSFSISWSRLFPSGTGELNQKGLQHYLDLVDYMKDQGIEPIITLFSGDLPLALQKSYGGFFNERIISDFTNYSEAVFEKFAGNVKYFITVDSPSRYCKSYVDMAKLGLEDGAIKDPTEQFFKCGHYSLLAHASAVEIFRKSVLLRYRESKISFKDSFAVPVPFNNSGSYLNETSNSMALKRAIAFNVEWFSKPIYVDGDYPDVMKETLGSLLPTFSDEQKHSLLKSTDFFSWNGYAGLPILPPIGGIESCITNRAHPLWPVCVSKSPMDSKGYSIGSQSDPTTPWLYNAPTYFGQGLQYLWDTFKPNGGILIAGLGFSVPNEGKLGKVAAISDNARVEYYSRYLEEIVRLVSEQGVQVIGTLASSLVDGFEWKAGFTPKFGIQYVDFTSMERTYKKSAFFISQFFRIYCNSAALFANNTLNTSTYDSGVNAAIAAVSQAEVQSITVKYSPSESPKIGIRSSTHLASTSEDKTTTLQVIVTHVISVPAASP